MVSYDRHSDWDDYQTKLKADPVPKGDTGVGGIRFAPLDCNDEDLQEWRIVNYGDRAIQKRNVAVLFF